MEKLCSDHSKYNLNLEIKVIEIVKHVCIPGALVSIIDVNVDTTHCSSTFKTTGLRKDDTFEMNSTYELGGMSKPQPFLHSNTFTK